MAGAGIHLTPGSLKEAIEELKVNPIAEATLGSHLFDKYIEAKEAEWDRYQFF